VHTVVLLGYAYGSLITSLCPSPCTLFPDKIFRSSHILLSHPLGAVQVLASFNSAQYAVTLDKLLGDRLANVLMVHGSKDQFTNVKRYEAWSERHKQIREAAGIFTSESAVIRASSVFSNSSDQSLNTIAEKIVNRMSSNAYADIEAPTSPREHGEHQVRLVHHADHFWRGRHTKELQHIVRDWIKRLDAGEFDLSSK